VALRKGGFCGGEKTSDGITKDSSNPSLACSPTSGRRASKQKLEHVRVFDLGIIKLSNLTGT